MSKTQTEQIATTIHEALHIGLGFSDGELKGWLRNFGFKPEKYGSDDITSWIARGCQ